ncbi:MFS transporter [Novosphingobium mangrovi (ex Hu et al. 2023)]|uniref:MFS transporter n=1 Tax=Novosphingobium mangrovi (ex Hu et al. 2023) TaxID=2930094 RepID=A0ABT0ABU5_9SPHN|nr:MFS transporter [Novosphingobium mangrovi (ex Hu et al. 2023)]MCJ1960670.1 MFS transporter [Novosphingobium mangrovi (ex Hu et al. 2023)]
MQVFGSGFRIIAPAIGVAALAILQPGIDPVFLALLSEAHALSPDLHGWVVAAAQAGLALGSLLSLFAGARLPSWSFAAAALAAMAAALATGAIADFPALLALRAAHGAAMGLIYTQAMAHAARHRPTGAFAAALLVQLLLSMVVAAGLPSLADQRGASAALELLALAPFAILLILATCRDALGQRSEWDVAPRREALNTHATARAITPRTLLIAGAIFAFVCANMIVWSLTGALALGAGLGNDTLGTAVSLGSLAGAVTALAVLRERILVPPTLTALLCGAALLAPMLGARAGQSELFIASIVLFNIGATASVIRCSGLAAASCTSSRALRFVSSMQTLGMIAGPALGSLAAMGDSRNGPLEAAALATVLACGAFIAWQRRPVPQVLPAELYYEERQAA